MQIIDKTKPPSSKFTRQEHPTSFKYSIDEQRYWEEQYRRWIEGYAGLTGPHYFYLQEIMIPAQSGGIIHPMWRDVDDLVFGAFDEARFSKKDLLIGKRRGVGLTSIFGAAIPLYYCLTVPGTKVPMTSADKDRVEKILSEKLWPAIDNLNPFYKQEVGTDRKDELVFGKKTIAEVKKNGKIVKEKRMEGIFSTVLCKQTQVNPTAFEGTRALYGFLDEIFLHPKANIVSASMADCFGEGFEKNGTLVMGGSAGEEHPKSLENARQMWLEAETLDIITLFIPSWMGLKGFMINGHSQEKEAKEEIDRKREQYSKLTDQTKFRKYVHSHPHSIEELFAIKESVIFPPEVVEALNKQLNIILNPELKKPIYRGYFKEMNDKVVWVADNMNGKVQLLEHPVPGRVYGGSIDPIPGMGDHVEGSDNALVLLDFETGAPVLIYAERSFDYPKIVEQCILAQRYFNDAKVLAEKQQGGALFIQYKEDGYFHLLADTLSETDAKYKGPASKKGINASTKNIGYSIQAMIKHLVRHANEIYLPDVIYSLLKFGIQNADIADAYKWAIVYYYAYLSRLTKKQEAPTTYRVPTYKFINGRNQLTYHEIRVKQ